jgi:hypothetical protein
MGIFAQHLWAIFRRNFLTKSKHRFQVFDQHISELGARPPEPPVGPQRRDQHAQGQRQPHEGQGRRHVQR